MLSVNHFIILVEFLFYFFFHFDGKLHLSTYQQLKMNNKENACHTGSTMKDHSYPLITVPQVYTWYFQLYKIPFLRASIFVPVYISEVLLVRDVYARLIATCSIGLTYIFFLTMHNKKEG